MSACGEEQILFTTPHQVCSWMCTASVSIFIHLCLQVVHDVLSPAGKFFTGVNSKDVDQTSAVGSQTPKAVDHITAFIPESNTHSQWLTPTQTCHNNNTGHLSIKLSKYK